MYPTAAPWALVLVLRHHPTRVTDDVPTWVDEKVNELVHANKTCKTGVPFSASVQQHLLHRIQPPCNFPALLSQGIDSLFGLVIV